MAGESFPGEKAKARVWENAFLLLSGKGVLPQAF
jgi:hypothetical protein